MFHLTLKSNNKKTGNIPVTVSERDTCPATCPFYDKGCYAKAGHLAIHWTKVSKNERGMIWDAFIKAISSLQLNTLWRHNAAGDLCHNEGMIDTKKLEQLTEANKGKKGFTYTHHVRNEHNIEAIKKANANGFTINASCESVETADSIMTDYGLPAVAVIASAEKRTAYRTDNNRAVKVCPATYRDDITCKSCGLCQKATRNYIIAFPAHGNAKQFVNDNIVGQ